MQIQFFGIFFLRNRKYNAKKYEEIEKKIYFYAIDYNSILETGFFQ